MAGRILKLLKGTRKSIEKVKGKAKPKIAEAKAIGVELRKIREQIPIEFAKQEEVKPRKIRKKKGKAKPRNEFDVDGFGGFDLGI